MFKMILCFLGFHIYKIYDSKHIKDNIAPYVIYKCEKCDKIKRDWI